MQLRYNLVMYKQVFSLRQLVETPVHENSFKTLEQSSLLSKEFFVVLKGDIFCAFSGTYLRFL